MRGGQTMGGEYPKPRGGLVDAAAGSELRKPGESYAAAIKRLGREIIELELEAAGGDRKRTARALRLTIEELEEELR